jgi:hypothetical protein
MTLKGLFLLNGVIGGGYGIALLVAADPILDLYGITPIPKGSTWPAGSGWNCLASAL